MNHRIVSIAVGLLLATFIGAAALFAWTVDLRSPERPSHTPAANPHPPEAVSADCRRCHRIEGDSLPITHRDFDLKSCESCHPLAPPARVPHAVTGAGAGCAQCHGDPALRLGIPTDHLGYRPDRCQRCHEVDPARTSRQPRPAGVSRLPKPPVPHGVTGIFENCTYCHKVEGTPPMPANHAAFDAKTCGGCHQPVP